MSLACIVDQRIGERAPRRSALAQLAFTAADCLFLIVVALGGVLLMHWMHSLGFGFLAALLLGMAASMFFQALASAIVAPVLGSIESMIPSMIITMLLPMMVCFAEAAGFHLSLPLMAGAAVAAAVLELTALGWYSTACRKRLECRSRYL